MFNRSRKDTLTVKKIRKDTPGNRGFSLVEIIVVIAIMGTMIAIAMPSIINYYPHMQLKQTSMEIYTALQRARSKAVGSTDRYGVEFNLGDTPQTYRLMTSTDGGVTWAQDTRSALQEVSVHTLIDSTGSNIGGNAIDADNNNIISFSPVGTATQATIELENTRDNTDIYQITVNSMTGRVRIIAGGV